MTETVFFRNDDEGHGGGGDGHGGGDSAAMFMNGKWLMMSVSFLALLRVYVFYVCVHVVFSVCVCVPVSDIFSTIYD